MYAQPRRQWLCFQCIQVAKAQPLRSTNSFRDLGCDFSHHLFLILLLHFYTKSSYSFLLHFFRFYFRKNCFLFLLAR